jgi:hypothetical protein
MVFNWKDSWEPDWFNRKNISWRNYLQPNWYNVIVFVLFFTFFIPCFSTVEITKHSGSKSFLAYATTFQTESGVNTTLFLILSQTKSVFTVDYLLLFVGLISSYLISCLLVGIKYNIGKALFKKTK